MKPLIAVSEHENWIQVDKSICGSDPFTVDLSQWGGGGETLLHRFHTLAYDKPWFTGLLPQERTFGSKIQEVVLFWLALVFWWNRWMKLHDSLWISLFLPEPVKCCSSSLYGLISRFYGALVRSQLDWWKQLGDLSPSERLLGFGAFGGSWNYLVEDERLNGISKELWWRSAARKRLI